MSYLGYFPWICAALFITAAVISPIILLLKYGHLEPKKKAKLEADLDEWDVRKMIQVNSFEKQINSLVYKKDKPVDAKEKANEKRRQKRRQIAELRRKQKENEDPETKDIL